MKTLFASLFFLLALHPATAQNNTTSLDAVTTAIGAGNVNGIVAAMGRELELSILDDRKMHAKPSASAALQTFYQQFGTTSFGKVHQGASKADDAEYCIGTLTTDRGNYRVYVYVAKTGQGVELQELRFESN